MNGARCVRLTRSGGVAGLTLVAAVTLDDLPAATLTKVRTALRGLSHPARRARSVKPAGATDLFQYELVVEEPDGGRQLFSAREGEVTAEMQTLLDVLLPMAAPE